MHVTRDFRVYGHRGAPKEHPENTWGACKAALAAGCNALELDVHLSLDGYVVVAHDDSAERMAKLSRRIRTSPWHEVARWNVARGFTSDPEASAHPPLLEDIIDAFGHVPISVDLKDRTPALAAATVKVLARAKAVARRLVSLTSFHQGMFGALRKQAYDGPLGMGPTDVLRLWSLPLAMLGDLRGRAAQVPTSYQGIELATERFVRKAHALACRVDYWVVNDADLACSLIAMGADGIVTDDVRPLRASLPKAS